MSIKSAMPLSLLILCHPLLLQPLIFPSIRVFSNESVLCIRWPKYWSFSFSLSPPKEHSGLISFRIDWFDLTVQGILKSLLQHPVQKLQYFRCSAFCMVLLSHPYMITEKNHSFDYTDLCQKVMSLLFSMWSRFVIACLPRSKHFLISWQQSPSAVIFGAQENEVCHCFHCFPIYLP